MRRGFSTNQNEILMQLSLLFRAQLQAGQAAQTMKSIATANIGSERGPVFVPSEPIYNALPVYPRLHNCEVVSSFIPTLLSSPQKLRTSLFT